MPFGERVMAFIPPEAVGKEPRRSSKFSDRWLTGVRLGKTEESDEHMILSDGMVSTHRTIRRFPEGSDEKWNVELLMKMTAVPWDARSRVEALGGRAADKRGAASADARAVVEAARGISTRGLEGFPATKGCAACARRGSYGHGFHHSMECRRLKLRGKERQETRTPVGAEEVPQPVRRRVVGKTDPTTAALGQPR